MGIATAAWGLVAAAHADVRETTLVIGEGWAVVREVHRVVLSAGEQDLWLEGIPREADLSSLTLRMRRLPIELLEWERHPRPSDASSASSLLPEADAWTPKALRALGRSESAASAPDQPVRCRIRSPAGGEQSLEVSYIVQGIEWSVQYEVFLRGDPAGSGEQISVDWVGTLRFLNQTDRAFSNALVRLVGSDRRLPKAASRRPGFLSLEDGPLSDLWAASRPDPPPEFAYRLPRRVSLPARTETAMPFITAQRIPANRLYGMDSDQVPLSLTGVFHPLSHFLVFTNSAPHGLGWMLPPGPVKVYHGVTRRTLLQAGYVPHTPVDQIIRVELGQSAHVRGMRRTRARTPEQFGYLEELYELVIDNQRGGKIDVEIAERPPTTLTWNVQRASEDYVIDRNRIVMNVSVSGRDPHRVELRLRFHQPSL